MKPVLIFLSLILSLACSRTAQEPVANANTNRPLRSEQMQSTTAHTTENQTPRPANSESSGGKWSQSGDPVDTSVFDGEIAAGQKALKADPGNDEKKKMLARAYYERGVTLTEARQYAAAIGDYRRALKHDPDHADSKQWIEKIVSIYTMLKKEPPKEGEEPPPLPFKREA